MFETSVVRAQALPSKGKVSLLTISLVAHSAVIIGAIAISIVSVKFPKTAPNEFARAPIFASVSIPPPLGNPNAGAKPKQPEAVKPSTPPPPAQLTAPSTVPETTTPAQSASTGTEVATTTGTEEGPIGVPWGTKDSIGDPNSPPATTTQTPIETKIYKVGEVKAPVIITRVEPLYPPLFMRARMAGTVAVHCVIDKNGRVTNAQIVYATNPTFAQAVLDVLPRWRYNPATHNGSAVDCYLDLNVGFQVK